VAPPYFAMTTTIKLRHVCNKTLLKGAPKSYKLIAAVYQTEHLNKLVSHFFGHPIYHYDYCLSTEILVSF